MKISKSKLLPALEQPVRICQSKMGRSTRLLISALNNTLKIEANDGDQSCSVHVECDGNLAPVCVPPNALHTAVSFGGDEVFLEMDGEHLVYKSETKVRRMPTVPASTFQRMTIATKLVVLSAEVLSRGINAVRFATAADSYYKDHLKNVHVLGTATRLRCEAGNGADMAFFDGITICADVDILIPRQFASSVADALSLKSAELAVGDNVMTVRHEDGYYTCKLAEGIYPNFMHVFGLERNEIGMADRNEWINAFRYLKSGWTSDGTSLLKVHTTFTEKQCLLKTSDDQQIIEGNFQPRAFYINAIGFLECLLAFDEGSTIKMSVAEDCRATILSDGELTVATCQVLQ